MTNQKIPFEIIHDDDGFNKLLIQTDVRPFCVTYFVKSEESKLAIDKFTESYNRHSATTTFVLFNFEKYKGNNKEIKSLAKKIPYYECYYDRKTICQGSNFNSLENDIQSVERYSVSAKNQQINHTRPNNKQNALITPNLIANCTKELMDQLQISNPPQYNFFVQNPNKLQEAVIDIINNQLNNKQQINNQYNMQNQVQRPTYEIQTALGANSTLNVSEMKTWFKIFIEMQKLGIPLDKFVEANNNDIEILPDGRRIVSLGNDKYGVIENIE